MLASDFFDGVLLQETWNTDWTGTSTDGNAAFRGFYGTYEITVSGYAPVQVICASANQRAAKAVLEPAGVAP